jgi:hypothetical protein
MDDPLLVRGLQGLRDVTRDRQRFVERNGPLGDAIGQRRPFYQFQDKGHDAVRIFETVDAADVRVVERRKHPRFAPEARDLLGVVCERLGQDLQRDVAIELRIARAVHLAQPTFADLGGNFIDAEARPGGESQEICPDYTGEAMARTGLLLCDGEASSRSHRQPIATMRSNPKTFAYKLGIARDRLLLGRRVRPAGVGAKATVRPPDERSDLGQIVTSAAAH